MKKAIAVTILVFPWLLSVAGFHFYGYPGIAAGLIGVALIVAGIKAKKLPLVSEGLIKGANGRNRPLFVQINPKANYHRAVLAQEIWESIHKTNPINLIRSRTKSGQRDMELMGHEVEVQAAVLLYGVNETVYRKAEAERMRGGYGGIFKDMTVGDIAARMARHRKEASEWVRDNRERFI